MAPGHTERASQHNALLRLLAAALDCVPRPEPWLDKRLDWDALIAVAAAGRLLTHVYEGAMICGIDAPQSLRDAARAFRGRALLVNSVNLSTIQRVTAALDQSGLPFVLIKGPLQLHTLYGDYFIRPSTDIDLLVDDHDYDRTASALARLGYRVAQRCESRWWRHYLGEQHFMASDAALATVDLHHRVQQPGCPAPRELATYIRDSSRVGLGHAEVPVLSGVHACLLMAISFVKAVYHREHSMRYLCDLTRMLRGMDEKERLRLLLAADRQGLRNQLIFAWRSAADLLSVASPPVPPPEGAALIGRAELAVMTLTPESAAIRWPRRRELLWHLCDPRGMLGRLGPYSREAAFAAAAEYSRLRND
ncbi:hypothetical protein WP12_00765 [Sphingomonas sp. SRS2]|nr:hypothetical protein WP12_00765 [Sphingomonas sp. SRS2]